MGLSTLPARRLVAVALLIAASSWPGAPAAAAPADAHAVRRHLAPAVGGERLGFPYQVPSAAIALYDFGLDPWAANGEIHTGIDIEAAHRGSQPTMMKATIVAPAAGRVEWVLPGTSGAGLYSVLIVVRMNAYWLTTLTIEPQSASPATNAEQAACIHVVPGQTVHVGETIAELVVWNVADGSYPHVHLSLFYKTPSQTLDELAEHILEVGISDGTALPPLAGPGSPWNPTDLGIPSTAFCPYEYSTPQARAIYDILPAYAANGDSCSCPCAYGSAGGDCGACGH
jgi:hypothetical protein